ncbi:MAG: hypothetical protein BGO98_14550 [Myxococcales bacterium 68-20]|nr:MAG: hypothetical protein BGO98_14550 [Myxococcales bacterium 68-20]
MTGETRRYPVANRDVATRAPRCTPSKRRFVTAPMGAVGAWASGTGPPRARDTELDTCGKSLGEAR